MAALGGTNLLSISKRYSMSLLGPFRLSGPGGEPFVLPSKKGVALLAMLATSPNGERTRSWLKERLWGSRGEAQTRASMRRELANLRKSLGAACDELLQVDAGRVRLRLEKVSLDVVRVQPEGWAAAGSTAPDAEFLEGIDIRGEEAFEAWLRLIRISLATARKLPQALPEPLRARSDLRPTPRGGNSVSATLTVWLSPLGNTAGAGTVARALVNDIAGLLACVRWLRVVTGELGAGCIADSDIDFIVEREIVSGDPDEPVELRLLRADSRELVWRERLSLRDETMDCKPAVRLAARVVARIEREEQIRASQFEARDDDFRILIWQARWRLNRLTGSDATAATRLIDRALAIAPQAPEALVQKAIAAAWEKWARRATRHEFLAVADLARRVILLDPDDCRGYWLAGVAETWLCNTNASIAWLRRAIEIEPTFEPAYAQLGSTLNMCDRAAEAIEVLNLAMRLSPNDTHLFFLHSEIAWSSLLLGRFEEAIEWADRALLPRPGYWYAQTIKIHALVEMGRLGSAANVYKDISRQLPNFSEEYVAWVPFIDRSWVQRLMASVRVAIASGSETVSQEAD